MGTLLYKPTKELPLFAVPIFSLKNAVLPWGKTALYRHLTPGPI